MVRPTATLRDRFAMAALVEEAVEVLEALRDPEGHIWHGAHSQECTGECKAIRAFLAKAREVRP